MNIRWFWYISVAKVRELDAQTHSAFRGIFRNLKATFELTLFKVKGSVGFGEVLPVSIVYQLNTLEKKLRSSTFIPTVDKISSHHPVFFEFHGFAGKYIQSFRSPKPREAPGEDFYPAGAFVIAGFQGSSIVILIGNANNTYGSPDKDVYISTSSQQPMITLLRLTAKEERPVQYNQRVLSSISGVIDQCDWSSVAKVRAIAIFSAKIPLLLPTAKPADNYNSIECFDLRKALMEVNSLVVGSPIFVEQLPEESD
jgi:hypothetical protein